MHSQSVDGMIEKAMCKALQLSTPHPSFIMALKALYDMAFKNSVSLESTVVCVFCVTLFRV